LVAEGRTGEAGGVPEGRADESGAVTKDHAGKAGPATEDRTGEGGTAWQELFEVSPDLQPSDTSPFAPRKIREIAKFKPGEIDFAPRRFGKVDAGECHSVVFVRRIAPPCVPGVLSLCREVEKKLLIVHH